MSSLTTIQQLLIVTMGAAAALVFVRCSLERLAFWASKGQHRSSRTLLSTLILLVTICLISYSVIGVMFTRQLLLIISEASG